MSTREGESRRYLLAMIFIVVHTYFVGKLTVAKRSERSRMNSLLRRHVDNLDTYLYWFSVALVAIGLINSKFMPPKIDVVALSGIFFFCLVLKPLIITRSR